MADIIGELGQKDGEVGFGLVGGEGEGQGKHEQRHEPPPTHLGTNVGRLM